MQNPTLSLVLPTLNRLEMVKTCLESVRSQTFCATEIIVVDQSDNEDTKKYFESLDMGALKKTYVFQKTKSLILARNKGLDHAGDTDFLLFLEDDSILAPNYFEVLLKEFAKDAKKEVAGVMGTYKGAKYQENKIAKLFMLAQAGDGKFLPNGQPTFPYWKNEPAEVEFLSGGNTMYRTEIIKKFRYDERLTGYGYGDDVDVSFRISRKYKMFYVPEAVYEHEEHGFQKDRAFILRKGQLQNYYYLTEKNIGSGLKPKFLFAWFSLGQLIDDIRKFRKGAAAGDVVAICNILRGKLDTVQGYRDFKSGRS